MANGESRVRGLSVHGHVVVEHLLLNGSVSTPDLLTTGGAVLGVVGGTNFNTVVSSILSSVVVSLSLTLQDVLCRLMEFIRSYTVVRCSEIIFERPANRWDESDASAVKRVGLRIRITKDNNILPNCFRILLFSLENNPNFTQFSAL
jgi:hypothetical protein